MILLPRNVWCTVCACLVDVYRVKSEGNEAEQGIKSQVDNK